jgi:hypothetical protein
MDDHPPAGRRGRDAARHTPAGRYRGDRGGGGHRLRSGQREVPAPSGNSRRLPHARHAAGYFDYFGAAAGSRSTGWYSFDVGAWHLIALNSECAHVGGCGRGSRQERWLRADLAAHRTACTLAYWHKPRFSSGLHGDDPADSGEPPMGRSCSG